MEAMISRSGRKVAMKVVFVPVVTNNTMETLATRGRLPGETDYVLYECMLALHFLETGQMSGIYPLIVGDVQLSAQGRPEWDDLYRNPRFKEHVAAMPDIFPEATHALATRVAAADGVTLLPTLADATVRDVVLGRLPGLPGRPAAPTMAWRV